MRAIRSTSGTDGTPCLMVDERYQIYLDNGAVYDTIRAKDIPQDVFEIRDIAMTAKLALERRNQITGNDWFENDLGMIIGHKEKIIPETVGQYTGLHDKNGKLIFEGDILRAYLDKAFPENETIVTVVWANNAWCTKQDGAGAELIENDEMDYFGWEVIGNIRDNLDLLEAQK